MNHAPLAQWFAHEVQPHEPALRAYLRVRFPALRDMDNLIQETFARIVKARDEGAIHSPKALLFTMARNTAIDLLRREKVVQFETIGETAGMEVVDDTLGTAENLSREQELILLEEAVKSLPARCREILVLKKIEGLSYAEIGARLGIKHNTISAQLTLGVLRCRRFLEERGVNSRRKDA